MLIAWSRNKIMEAGLVGRARMVLKCIEGEPVSQIATRKAQKISLAAGD